ncbi:cation diffusion facilitator family transporter [Pseudonocardia kujensis]|uniref:cation diffusion facilitator family transporter n=1 Tax=Pseudonocardia kujensis TaxID=1128675 RepID=UPI001E2884F3|nr:cation diffusion facilitator family transporter [Pseudonocardia kujensis]MCE0766487.1 cation diffusion facilitator family transporter [Pseudonocardia kujensis]
MTSSPDHRVLAISLWSSAGFAVLALVWGALTGSRLIVFDGLYSFASVGLTLLAVLALRTARRGPDERYPWGREAWEPLAVVLKAAAMAGLCVYALVGAVLELIEGPTGIAVRAALVYGVVSTVGGVVVTVLLRRMSARGSDLARAEAAEWAGDTLLSVGVLVGFGVAWALEASGRAAAAASVDPVMVVLASAAFLPVPVRLILRSGREILTMAPPAEVLDRIRAEVGAVEEAYGFAESFVRAGKVGGRLDLEVDFVVDGGSAARTVEDLDGVRAELDRRLRDLDPPPSMSVGFTADRGWVS